MRDIGPDSVISVVAPFYNEVKNIKTFVEELVNEFEKIGYADKHEMILVNDGSTDGSDRELERIITDHAGKTQGDPSISELWTCFSRICWIGACQW